MHLKKKLSDSNRKPDKIWFYQGSEFSNTFKDFLKIDSIENRQHLLGLIFKHMTAISKNVYFDMLDDVVNKYNRTSSQFKFTVHRTIKLKPIDATDDSYAEYNKDSNKKDSNFKVGDHVRISKHKNIFDKGYTPNQSEEVFVTSKTKNAVIWTYVINDLNGEEITGSFYEERIGKD